MTSRFRDSPLGVAIQQLDWWGIDASGGKTFARALAKDFYAVLDQELRRTRGRPWARSKRVVKLLTHLHGLVDGDNNDRLTRSIEHALTVAETPPTITSRGTVSRLAESLTNFAVVVLPPRDRARYREEFQAEMYDLRRREQIAYGFRQLVRSLGLRQSLTPLRASAPTRDRRWRFAITMIAVSVVALAVVGFISVTLIIFWP